MSDNTEVGKYLISRLQDIGRIREILDNARDNAAFNGLLSHQEETDSYISNCRDKFIERIELMEDSIKKCIIICDGYKADVDF